MILMLAAMLAGAPALAQDADPTEPETEIAGPPRDRYVFALDHCDGIRARVVRGNADPIRSHEVDLLVVNQSSSFCTYDGIILKGFLEGSYRVYPRLAPGDKILVGPSERVVFRVVPNDPIAPRGDITLEAAPGRGVLLFKGFPPNGSPERPGETPTP